MEKCLGIIGFNDISRLYGLKYNGLSLSDTERIKLAQEFAFTQDVAVVIYPPMCLNAEAKISLKKLMRERLNDGTVKSVLILGEDLEFIGSCADEIYILEDGRVTASGAKDEIIFETDAENDFAKSLLIKVKAVK